ncbi:MAG: S1 RNA-binding domain-containing protein [Ruminococcus sp.]
MQVEIGKIYEGTVKNITKYGAFVEIPNPDGDKIMGMVHISEVSRSYVNEIRDFVTEGQQVRVKAIGTNPQGKISLSMKQAEEGAEQHGQRRGGNHGAQRQTVPWKRRCTPRTAVPSAPQQAQCLGAEKAGTLRDDLRGYAPGSSRTAKRMCDIKRNTERKNRSSGNKICIHIAYAVHTGFQRFGQSFGAAFFA